MTVLDSRQTTASKARYTMTTKLNSTQSTLLKVYKVDHVTLATYTLLTKSTVSATKLNVSATKSIATRCRIHVVADLLPKRIGNNVDHIRQHSTFNKVDRVEFNFVLCRQCVPGFTDSTTPSITSSFAEKLNIRIAQHCNTYNSST